MKRKSLAFIFSTLLILMVGCSENETVKSKFILPEDVPDFVAESDLENIDWDKKAISFSRNIIGNENRSGVIGADMPSITTKQKWMWHLWGIEDPAATNLTVVGLHRASGTVHPILTTGWTTGLAGPNNGADAHAPSNVQIPNAGEWAILLYTDEELFDVLIYEINE
ncbi:MAG TPA: hypothetical protein VFX34_03705 [Sporosarcina sp.]|nr:hypothetical protein [Sporosarcina sp.]